MRSSFLSQILSARLLPHRQESSGSCESERVKVSLFLDDIIIYINDPKIYQRTPTADKFCKVAAYKINSKKSVALL